MPISPYQPTYDGIPVPLAALVLAGYFAFSIWNAYSARYNRGLLRKTMLMG